MVQCPDDYSIGGAWSLREREISDESVRHRMNPNYVAREQATY